MSHHRCCCGGGGSCQCLGRCQFSDAFSGELSISSGIALGGSMTGRYCPNDVDCAPVCGLSMHGLTSVGRSFANVAMGCGNRCFSHTAFGQAFSNIKCLFSDTGQSQPSGQLEWCFGEGTLGNSEPVPAGVVLGVVSGVAIYVSVTVGSAVIDYPINRFELDQSTLLDNTTKRCSPGSGGSDRVRNIVWGMRSLANTTYAAGYTMHLGSGGVPLELVDDWGGGGGGGWFGSCGNEIASVNFHAFIHAHQSLNGCPLDCDATASGFAEYVYGGLGSCGGAAPGAPPASGDLPRRVENHALWKPGDPFPSGLPLTLYRARRTVSAAQAAEDLL